MAALLVVEQLDFGALQAPLASLGLRIDLRHIMMQHQWRLELMSLQSLTSRDLRSLSLLHVPCVRLEKSPKLAESLSHRIACCGHRVGPTWRSSVTPARCTRCSDLVEEGAPWTCFLKGEAFQSRGIKTAAIHINRHP